MTLREKLALLEKRAADKLAEIKDDTAADAARAIETDHEAILAEIAEVRSQIAAAEADGHRTGEGAAEKAVRAERTRTSEIRKLAREASEVDLGDEHIDAGRSVAEFRSALLEKLMSREAPATDNRSPARVGEEHHEKRAVAMRDALHHRADPRIELSPAAREYRGFSLMDMAREALEVRGVKTRGMSRDEIAGTALAQRSGYGSTSDFPIILGNVVNTTLRAGYEAAGQTFRPLVREATVSDFKPINRAQLGEGPAFDKVNESGEYKRGAMAEGKESYRIATFGKVIAITRQVIINDDMNAFGRIPQLMGGAAAQLESDLVWAQILGNPTMGDGTALFHASHNNLPTAAAFGVASLGIARATMAKQVGMDGRTVLNIRPQFLVVPVALETKAEQELKSLFYADSSDKVATTSMRSLEIIAEARLDNGIKKGAATASDIAGSATAWYLSASPAQVDTVELAYLEGNRGVYIETRQGFDVDGLEVKARLDVGAKTMDHRGLLKNAGQ
ncbi:prohead protease/major capsid protein fusion protein [Shinella zoogloeoides]